MSKRSYESASQDKRMSQHRVTDDQLFKCVGDLVAPSPCLIYPYQLRPTRRVCKLVFFLF